MDLIEANSGSSDQGEDDNNLFFFKYRGEVASSSCARKNRDRPPPAISNIRKMIGTKCDMIFRDKEFVNEEFREYGAAEFGRKCEGTYGTK